MARRTPDQGVRPFEVRTGVGGTPPLGGIYRSGDPATIPLHKHHLVINGRITPAGLTERPGLAPIFTSTIEECITGITEFRKLGGGVILWPGAGRSNGNGTGANPISMRSIFPTVSNVYSEYNILVDGAISNESCFSLQPIVVFEHAHTEPPNFYATGPFIYEGQIHYCKLDGSYECWTVPMPESAETQGGDFYRFSCCTDFMGVPVAPPDLCPPGAAWPRGHPFSTAGLVFRLPEEPFGPNIPVTISGVLAIPERADQALDGDLVVQESLYVIASGDAGGGTWKTKVYRWNGVSLTAETVTIVDVDVNTTAERYYVRACEGGGRIYLFLGGNEAAGDGGVCWVRDEDGAWAAVDGMRDGITTTDFYPVHGFVWAGVPYFLGLSNYFSGSVFSPLPTNLVLAALVGGEFVLDTDISALSGGQIDYVSHVRQIGAALYILGYGAPDGGPWGSAVINFDMATRQIVSELVIEPIPPENYEKYRWLEVVGTTAYLGGKFLVDLVLGAPEIEECHAVYDVTDPTAASVIYRRYISDWEEYAGNVYSQGALPLIPASGETGG